MVVLVLLEVDSLYQRGLSAQVRLFPEEIQK